MYSEYNKRRDVVRKEIDNYIYSNFCDVRCFGHMFTRHFNLTESALRYRALSQRVDTSSFEGSKDAILRMLIRLLIDSREELIDYLADTEDDGVWELQDKLPKNVSGIMYSHKKTHDWNDGPIMLYEFKIVLRKTEDKQGLEIVTAYPV